MEVLLTLKIWQILLILFEFLLTRTFKDQIYGLKKKKTKPTTCCVCLACCKENILDLPK